MYSIERILQILIDAGSRLSVVNDHEVRCEVQFLVRNLSKADLVPVFQKISEKRSSIPKFAFIYQDLCVGLGYHLAAGQVLFGPFKSSKPNIPDGIWRYGEDQLTLEIKSTLVVSENSLNNSILVAPHTEIVKKRKLVSVLVKNGVLVISDITLCRLSMIFPVYFKLRLSDGWNHLDVEELASVLARFTEFRTINI